MKKNLTFGTMYCVAQGTINGAQIEKDDFVNQYDHDPGSAEEYCCGDMRADIIPPIDVKGILKKYNITVEEYMEIAKELSDGLSFGRCCWCQ